MPVVSVRKQKVPKEVCVFSSEVVNRFSQAQDSLVIQQSDFSLSAIAEMVERASIDIAPHYQRRDRWHLEKQSALIESFLINVPVPPVYLSEDDYGQYSVIDGKQRITAIYEFLRGTIKLKGMKEFPELNGATFGELPTQLQNALSVRPYIRIITLLKQSDPELKYEVFLRLNTGGEKLRPQEVRNVAFSGPLNDLLFSLAENDFLRSKLKITSNKSTAYRNMDDLEHVLRFLTIRQGWERMRGKISIEMDQFMAEHRRGNVKEFEGQFTRAIEGCEEIWGEHAFQKPNESGWREQLISPLYDAQMVAVSLMKPKKIKLLCEQKKKVIAGTKKLYEKDPVFLKSVSQATGDASAIFTRVNAISKMLNAIEG